MPGIKFDITGDNSHFINSMKEIQVSVQATSKTMGLLSKEFDLDSVNNQVLALTKVIRSQEAVIIKAKENIANWMKDSLNARNENRVDDFNVIQNDIDAEIQRLQELIAEQEKYKDALEEIKVLNGMGAEVNDQILFVSEEQYERVKALKKELADLQQQKANHDGGDYAGLMKLENSISKVNIALREETVSAAESVAALGPKGDKIARLTTLNFELTDAIKQQLEEVARLDAETKKSWEVLVKARKSGDKSAFDDARIMYEAYADARESATLKLIGLQKELQNVEEASFRSLATQLRDAKNELQKLVDAGKEGAQEFEEVIEKISGLQKDLTLQELRIEYAGDNGTLLALKDGLQGIAGTASLATGALGLFNKDSEEMATIQTKVQSLLAITVGIQETYAFATKASTIATKLFNAAFKSGPWGWAVSAIIAVIGAISMYTSINKEATEEEVKRREEAEKTRKSQEEANQAVGSSVGKVEGKYRSLQKQWERLQTESEKSKWIKSHASDFKSLGLAVDKVNDAEKVLVEMAPQVISALKAVAKASAYENLYTEAIEKKIREWDNRTKSTATGDYYRQLTGREEKRIYTSYQKEWESAGLTAGDYFEYTTEGIGGSIKTEYKLTKQGIDKINSYRKDQAIALRKELEASYDEEIKKYEEGWTDSLNEADKAKKEIPQNLLTDDDGDDVKNDDNRAARNAKQLQDQWKHEEAMSTLEQNAARAREDASIAAIQNQGERERAERDAQYQRTIADLKDKEEDIYKTIYEQRKRAYEDANKDEKYENTAEGKAGYLSDDAREAMRESLSDEERRQFDLNQQYYMAEREKAEAEYKRQLDERAKQERQYLLDYIKEYGSIQDQRAAINEEYDRKIAEERNAIQKAALQKQKEQAIEELNFREWQESINWEDVFNDLQMQSSRSLEVLKKQLRDALTSGDVSAENAKVLAEKIREIEDLLSQRKDPFAAWLPGLRERLRLTNEVKVAEDEVAAASKRSADAMNDVLSQKQAIKDVLDKIGKKDALGEKIDVDLGAISFENKDSIFEMFQIDKNSELGNKLAEMFGVLAQKTVDLGNAEEETTKAVSNYDIRKDALKNFVKGGSISQYFTDVTAGMGVGQMASLINTNVQSMAEFVDKIGQGDTDFGKAVHDFADGVSGFNNAFQAIQSGDIFGAVNGVLDGIAGFGRLFTTIFAGSGNEEELEAEIAELSKSQRILAEAIEYFAGKITDSTATNAQSIEYYRQAYNAEQEWREKQQEKINKRAAEYANTGYGFLGLGGKSSFNALMAGNSWEGWKTLSDILAKHLGENGITHSSVNKRNIWDLTPEEMALLEANAPKEWEALMNGDGHHNPSELIDEYMEHAGDLMELTSALNEKLTGYSWDGFLDSYKSLLKDLDSTTEDFADHIQELITNALIEGFVNSEAVKGKIQDLYNKIAEYASDESEGGTDLTENEINDIRAANEDIANTLLTWREAAKQAGLITESSSSSRQQQSATANSISNISYDQADSLVGIETAQLIVQEQIKAILDEWKGGKISDEEAQEALKDTIDTLGDGLAGGQSDNDGQPYRRMRDEFEELITAFGETRDDTALRDFANTPLVPEFQAMMDAMAPMLAPSVSGEGTETSDLILANLQTMNTLISGDSGILSLMATANTQRESIYKEMKGFVAEMRSGFNRVVTELQNQ